ncbi:MAG: glycosyltransferase [Actinomycetota bacterium]|nr:glycosyltransferase [Actinomycetota bacterium]
MRDRRPHLYGILVTFRRPQALSAMLQALAEQTRPLHHLVVVDNGPTEEGRALVHAHKVRGSEVEYLALHENLGPAGGIASGMQRLLPTADDDDWVVLLDDDDPPQDHDVLEQLFRFAQEMWERDRRTGGVGLGGSSLDLRRGRLVRTEDSQLGGPVLVDHVPGNQLPLYRVEAIRRVGPFRAELFFGFEELEFGLRMRRAGYTIYAHGELWAQRRAALRMTGTRSLRPALRLPEPDWRRYYSLRNLIYILRSLGLASAAWRVTLVRGIGKPLANLPLNPRRAAGELASNWRACRDGWRGTLGRRVEPDPTQPRSRTVWSHGS